MKSFTYTVKDKSGLHARPAGIIVNCARAFASDVLIKKNGPDSTERAADAKKLISLMSLGIRTGDEITVIVSGADEIVAAKELSRVCRETLG